MKAVPIVHILLALTPAARAAEDIRGKTITFSREGVDERTVVRVLRNGHVLISSDGPGFRSACPRGSQGSEAILGRTHRYQRGCGERPTRATTRASYANGRLSISDEHQAGHTFYTNWSIHVSGRTCSGSQRGGYRSAQGRGPAATYRLANCRISE